MSSLLPGFSEQLSVRAEQLATEHQARTRGRSWRRPRGRRLFVTILVAGLGLGGGAYAGKGIWYPQVGQRAYEDFPGTVDYSPLPAAVRDSFAVFRREQSDSDRDQVARDLLKFSGQFQGVRTAYVRRLGALPTGAPIALVSRSQYRLDPANPERSEALCLFLGDGGGSACGSVAQAVNGKIDVGFGDGDLDSDVMHYVTLQPDGVQALRVESEGHAQVVRVRHNVALYTVHGPISDVRRVDTEGRPVRYLEAPAPLHVIPRPLDYTPSIQPSLVQKIMAGVWRDENAKLPPDLRLYFQPGMNLGHGLHEPLDTPTPPPDDPSAESPPPSLTGPSGRPRPGQ